MLEFSSLRVLFCLVRRDAGVPSRGTLGEASSERCDGLRHARRYRNPSVLWLCSVLRVVLKHLGIENDRHLSNEGEIAGVRKKVAY
jgi:hypothetical protein